MAELNTKTPPQSKDMEQAVLGCMLMGIKDAEAVLTHLDPEWLYKEAHQIIFKVFRKYVEDKIAPDLVLACQWLTNAGVLAEVGGQAYLMECMEKVSTAGHTQHYIAEIRKLYYDRMIIRAICTVEQDPSPENIEKLRCAREGKDGSNADGIMNLKDCYPIVDELTQPLAKGVYEVFGMEKNDEYHNGMMAGDILTIGARPAVGKTVIATHIAVNFARKYKEPVLYFSTEMSYRETLQRMLAPLSGVPGWKFRKRYFDKEGKDVAAICKAAGELSEMNIFVVDKQKPTLADVRAAMAATKARLVILDYLQVLNFEVERDEGLPAAMGRYIYGFKHSLAGLGGIGIMLSQLARDTDKLTKRESPQNSDLKGSGDIEGASNSVILAWRHNKKDRETKLEEVPEINNLRPVEFIHTKHRTGKTDVSVQMVFNENLIEFKEWNQEMAMKFADQIVKHPGKEKKDAKPKSGGGWTSKLPTSDSGGFTNEPESE